MRLRGNGGKIYEEEKKRRREEEGGDNATDGGDAFDADDTGGPDGTSNAERMKTNDERSRRNYGFACHSGRTAI